MNNQTANPTPETLFSQEAVWQSWLDVEAALARAQANIGMIPAWAAEDISANAFLDRIGTDALKASIKETMAPVLSLTRLLVERSGKSGDYVHWGATTQNVMQTGNLLIMRKAHQQILGQLCKVFESLATLADEHADTPMAGRTNRRHALPITFGFKVAGWIEELCRAHERLAQIETRTFCLPFGGAVGAMHSYGKQGRALSSALAKELNLGELLVPSRVVNDLFVDYVLGISMLAMSIERIALELYTLMEEEIGEISEQLAKGVVGSSTMPHKVNPKRVVKVIANCTRLRALAAPAMEAGRPSHEADASANYLLTSVIDDACRLGWELTTSFANLLERITVNKERMAKNLKLSGPAMASENLMMALAPHIGRNRAHDIIHHVIEDTPGDDITTNLANHPEIASHLTTERVTELLNVSNYTGDSEHIARDAARLSRTTANALANVSR